MNPPRPPLRRSPPTEAGKKLTLFRVGLLRLHKQLIDSERLGYEAAVGPIHTPNQFLQLLTSDPWFAWLRPLSHLIIAIDEAEDSREPLTEERIHGLMVRAVTLLTATEEGEGFSRHYFEALQRDPDVVLAHAELSKLFPARSPGDHADN